MKNILIVDDCPVVLAKLSDDLNSEYNVTTAISGEDAVEILDNPVECGNSLSNKFDLIITDLNMPEMSGFDLARYIRKRNKTNKFIPVVMLSSENITKDQARQHGCVAYISKAESEKLISLVGILLSNGS